MDKCWMVPPTASGDEKMIVVLPACDRDCQMMMKSLDWMLDLDGKLDFDALVAQDNSMNAFLAKDLFGRAQKVFRSVERFVYPYAPLGRWPYAANWAFQQTAAHFYESGSVRPWFWCEADCVPLRPGWLTLWQAEYASCKKPIMGAVIPQRGHCNGTAVYPWFFPQMSPSAMSCTNDAWDWVMRAETIRFTHDASRLMCHIWGIVDGKASPHSGSAASFRTQADVDRWVCKDAVLFHRSKDGTLIDRLRERLKK